MLLLKEIQEQVAAKREKLHRNHMQEARKHQPSFLVVNSVQPRTLADYRKRLAVFEAWMAPIRMTDLMGKDLWRMLVEYWEELFMSGAKAGEAEKLLAAVELLAPPARRGQEREPTNARLALRGFRRLSPTATRAPLPCVALCAMVGAALFAGEVDFAVAMNLSFIAYLRPGELIGLTGPQLVEPLAGELSACGLS